MKKNRVLVYLAAPVLSVSLLLSLILFSGCSVISGQNAAAADEVNSPESGADDGGNAPGTRKYKLNITRPDISLSKYEPPTGCYLGAYSAADRTIENSFDFDAAARKRHAIYEFHITAGNDIPESFLDDCANGGKTPLITIAPPYGDDISVYDARLLIGAAAQLGGFKYPAFVNLYPYAEDMGYDTALYAQFWNLARSVFNAYAPNAALVWSAAQTAGFPDYAPQIEGSFFQPQADWVGYELFVDIKGGSPDNRGVESFKEFYAAFQEERPIMLFVAVSHFSASDNTYYTKEAASAFDGIYRSVLADMPRVKAVIYLDYDGRYYAGINDYTVTGDDAARDMYRELIGDSKFLTEIRANGNGGAEGVTTRSPLPAELIGGEYYVPSRAVNALGIEWPPPGGVFYESGGIVIDGEVYAPLSAVSAFNPIDFYISPDDSTLVLISDSPP